MEGHPGTVWGIGEGHGIISCNDLYRNNFL
jgi:hypothetical protein